MFNATMLSIAQKINTYEDWRISREQSLALMPDDVEEAMDLLGFANKIRQRYRLRRVNKCESVAVARDMSLEGCGAGCTSLQGKVGGSADLRCADELIQAGAAVAASGGTHFAMVVSGGLSSAAGVETICRAARALRRRTKLVLCVSAERLGEDTARRLKAAGIDRYHLQRHAATQCDSANGAVRGNGDGLVDLEVARAAGLELCCAGLLGAGDTWAQRVDLALALRALDPAAITIRFGAPSDGAQLGQQAAISPMAALACIGLFRFVYPQGDIVVADGWERILGDFRSWVFFAGANGWWVAPERMTSAEQMVLDAALIAELGLINGRTAAARMDESALPRRHLAP
ncbi:hypothetical protein [Desulfatitalea alkaliphila]|uniref:Biotin and thiamin synthesis-associated domain-containing protein n=1 Tax=Desulfatitalea alkaliphila TaxID=2929485 RepID=A0AA41R4M9_9BACT|nr:hypothetical protein [Desulfatitalea alkaliphila]MCJ8500840.1 hypothetical protein [Desulfatitalea alkaliphila]